jgi:hypothetical protein
MLTNSSCIWVGDVRAIDTLACNPETLIKDQMGVGGDALCGGHAYGQV